MRHLFSIVFLCCWTFLGYSQNDLQEKRRYTDHRPEYRKWLDSYILDKIEYQPDATIFHFRFVCDNENSGGAVFYPPGGTYAWYLKGKSKNFEITAVKNVRRDGKLLKRSVTGSTFSADPNGPTGTTIFSCEVHFGPLDNEMKQADLIEGRGQEYNRRHFNCFNIKLKTWDDEDLGDENDSQETIREFEEKHTGKVVTVADDQPDPTPEKTIAQPEKTDTRLPPTPTPYGGSTKTLHQPSDIVCGETLVLDRIKFQDNSTEFRGMIAARETLFMLFEYLKEHPEATVTIYGHSDIFGDEERNIELSKKRAIKVQRWLSMYGINPRRIDYEWFGPKHPLLKEGGAANRRVEARLQCP